jgi:hypothetical protein
LQNIANQTEVSFYIGLSSNAKTVTLAHNAAKQTNYSNILDKWQKRTQPSLNPLNLVLKRAKTYSLQCCVPIDDEAVCILTDHMLLPLSWNRDAYYVASVLLQWSTEGEEQVRGHLLWMFERAQQPNGYWGRSYIANGEVKDRGYQLDQQIFPLLELANYIHLTNDHDLLARLRPHIHSTLNSIMARRDKQTGLFPTDETPADDPLDDYPFHFSSHILLWHTLRQLVDVIGTGAGQNAASLRQLANELKTIIEEKFIVMHNEENLYAYAVNANGGYRLYHDANDIPLVTMPLWNYCHEDNPVWRATVDFAWSPENEGGIYNHKLGSVHTPAPWSLGDAQELILAQLLGDGARWAKTVKRIQQVAQWDGALPEAYNGEDYSVVSRHWFAWTNAMVLLAEIYK